MADVRVVVDATSWSNDRGFGRFTRGIVGALAARRHGFAYTLLADEPLADAPPGCAVEAVACDRPTSAAAVGRGARSLLTLRALGRAAARLRPDLLFYPAVYSFFPARAAAPTVVCLHDATAERFPGLVFPTWRNRLLWKLKTRLALRQSTRVMTVSEHAAGAIEKALRVPRARIDVVTEGADAVFAPVTDRARVDALRARLDVPPAARCLVHVGGLNPHKNLLRLLDALPAVLAGHADVVLVLVGDLSGRGFFDNVAQVRARVDGDAALRRAVRLPGRLPDDEVAVLYSGSEAMVFPSLSEGFGLPALEAMRCGLPVLGSAGTSLPEVVGPAGRFFDPLSPASIAAAIVAFLDDSAAARALRAAALERARAFTWERAAEMAEASFERALASRRTADR